MSVCHFQVSVLVKPPPPLCSDRRNLPWTLGGSFFFYSPLRFSLDLTLICDSVTVMLPLSASSLSSSVCICNSSCLYLPLSENSHSPVTSIPALSMPIVHVLLNLIPLALECVVRWWFHTKQQQQNHFNIGKIFFFICLKLIFVFIRGWDFQCAGHLPILSTKPQSSVGWHHIHFQDQNKGFSCSYCIRL